MFSALLMVLACADDEITVDASADTTTDDAVVRRYGGYRYG